MYLIIGLLLVLSIATIVENFRDNTGQEIEEESSDIGDRAGCVFESENPEECSQTGAPIVVEKYET